MGSLDRAVSEQNAGKRMPVMEEVVAAELQKAKADNAQETKWARQWALDVELESVAILGYN